MRKRSLKRSAIWYKKHPYVFELRQKYANCPKIERLSGEDVRKIFVSLLNNSRLGYFFRLLSDQWIITNINIKEQQLSYYQSISATQRFVIEIVYKQVEFLVIKDGTYQISMKMLQWPVMPSDVYTEWSYHE